MNVERHAAKMLFQRLQIAFVDGADRMRRDAETRIGADSFGRFLRLPGQFRIAVEIIAEAQLPARQRPSVYAALHIGDRQQRQADARGALPQPRSVQTTLPRLA